MKLSTSAIRKHSLGIVAICLAAAAGVLTLIEMQHRADGFLLVPRRKVYVMWSLPALIAPVLAGIALLRSSRRKHGVSSALISIVGVLTGIIGLMGLSMLHKQASNQVMDAYGRAVCRSVLQKRIWVAIKKYAQEHEGKCPERLGLLYEGGLLRYQDMRCPLRREALPFEQVVPSLDNPDHPANTYEYRGAGVEVLTGSPVPILVEHLDNHTDGIHILLSDGSVRWIPAAEIVRGGNGIEVLAPPSE